MASTSIIGVNRLNLKLKKISDIDYTKPIKKGTSLVLASAIAFVPVDEGTLRSSIRAEVKKTKSEVIGKVFTNLEYAPYVEFGTGKVGDGSYPHKPTDLTSPLSYRQTGWVYYDAKQSKFIYTSGQVAQPYMYPALATNKKRIKELIVEHYNKEIRKLILKAGRK